MATHLSLPVCCRCTCHIKTAHATHAASCVQVCETEREREIHDRNLSPPFAAGFSALVSCAAPLSLNAATKFSRRVARGVLTLTLGTKIPTLCIATKLFSAFVEARH